MKKSDFSAEQLSFRQELIATLTTAGWSGPRHAQAFEADLILDTQLEMTKRSAQCRLSFRFSFEYDYLALLVIEPSAGQADYVVYHRGDADALLLVHRLLLHAETMDFLFSRQLFKALCRERPGDIYFFDGATSVLLTPETLEGVIEGSSLNRPL